MAREPDLTDMDDYIGVRVPRDVGDRLRKAARHELTNVSQLARKWIIQRLDKDGY